jgi:hypothetical protein
VLEELEEWVEADEGWRISPNRPTNCTRWNDGNPRRLHGNERDESQATERMRHWAALASSQRALENHSSAGKDRKPAERSGLIVVKNYEGH